MTLLEGAMVISSAGTSGTKTTGKELIVSEVRKTLSDTHAREQSETLLSDRKVSAHTDTNTLLLAQISALQQELAQTKAENIIFKAQVVERSSSSTSVNTQLVQLKDEIQNIRTSLIPKLNSLQTSQQQATTDIASISQSQFQQADNGLQLATISGQVDVLHISVLENDNVVALRFERVEERLEHLNTGIMHRHNMIKKEHPPTGEERTFFEGGPGDGGGSGGGGGSGSKALAQEKEKRILSFKSLNL